MFNQNSTIGDMLKNPVGNDVITTITEQVGIPKAFIYNPLSKSLQLSHLMSMAKGAIDDTFIDMLCDKMNQYDGIQLSESSHMKKTWWKEAVAYQIYPRSFKDSNGDGVGDLGGIIEKLDYLQDLGINLLWLSPIYDSPNDDNGYDIRDYYQIMSEFGTMEQFDQLLDQAHSRGIKLIMDLVINHTSDEHEWFEAAKEDESSPYHKYYMWKKGVEGTYPNNWVSFFSGPAWNYYPNIESYALHLFSKKQMDLNWEHEPMRQDLYKMIRFWLDKGIDGFRLDVINFISKEDGLPQGSDLVCSIMGQCGAEHYFFGPKLHTYLHEMNQETFSKYDVVTVGETPGIGVQLSEMLTHEDRQELDMIFNFEHLEQIGKSRKDDYRYDANHLKNVFIKWQTKYNQQCWNSVFYDNHDNPRMLTKIDPTGRYRSYAAKMLAMLQMTLKGTPFIYQGQELGLVNGVFETLDDYRDVESINLYHELKEKGEEEDAIMKTLFASTRDHARIPIPWNQEAGNGFTSGEPWIKAQIKDTSITAESETADDRSVYHFYRKLIELRKEDMDLVYGDFEAVHEKRKNYFGYYRHGDSSTYFIDMNLSEESIRAYEPSHQYDLLMSNYPTESTMLRPYECRMFKVER